jgi:hypothetical protein
MCIAGSMIGVLVSVIGRPIIMNTFSSSFWQNPGVVDANGAAFLIQMVVCCLFRTRGVHPMIALLDTQAGFVKMDRFIRLDQILFNALIHRFHELGRLMAGFHNRSCSHCLVEHVHAKHLSLPFSLCAWKLHEICQSIL